MEVRQQNRQAATSYMSPHEMAVFEERLKKPFFLDRGHKESIKTAADSVKAE